MLSCRTVDLPESRLHQIEAVGDLVAGLPVVGKPAVQRGPHCRQVDRLRAERGGLGQRGLSGHRPHTRGDLVDAFVKFAHDPSNNPFADLRLADTMDLGLGPAIIKTVRAADPRQSEAWQLDDAVSPIHHVSRRDPLRQLEGDQVRARDECELFDDRVRTKYRPTTVSGSVGKHSRCLHRR